MKIYERPAKKIVEEALQDNPVVSILGPRQAGKTTLAKAVAPDREYLTLDDENLLARSTPPPVAGTLQISL